MADQEAASVRIHHPAILADDGTRVLIGGTTADGTKVAAHIVLTTADGVHQVRRLRQGDVAWIDLPKAAMNGSVEGLDHA